MKVLLFNGSSNEHGCTYTALEEAASSLKKNGIETEIIQVGKMQSAIVSDAEGAVKTEANAFLKTIS